MITTDLNEVTKPATIFVKHYLWKHNYQIYRRDANIDTARLGPSVPRIVLARNAELAATHAARIRGSNSEARKYIAGGTSADTAVRAGPAARAEAREHPQKARELEREAVNREEALAHEQQTRKRAEAQCILLHTQCSALENQCERTEVELADTQRKAQIETTQ
ncbi:hypothetical protein BJ138DRAFT_1103112, partial [Hygrophoropsis aurantiaca]